MVFDKFQKRQGGGGFGGGKPFGGKKFGGGPRPMFQAVCSQCGNDCEVPFKPTGERPIYCSNCFKNQAGPSARFAGKPSFERGPRPSFGGNDRPSFGAMPAGRQGGQGGSQGGGNQGGGVSKAQFESLNQKLDKIIAMLGGVKTELTKSDDFYDPALIKKDFGKKEVGKKEKKVAPKAEKKSKAKKK
ncbi:MAG: hypothetical protein Q7K39_03070 [Candidatus Magasanikbacteria bacterium]|nr:hypothetical protein [Candidatus Magasanikbacteria bacterium]